jgi:hypothetical protein
MKYRTPTWYYDTLYFSQFMFAAFSYHHGPLTWTTPTPWADYHLSKVTETP